MGHHYAWCRFCFYDNSFVKTKHYYTIIDIRLQQTGLTVIVGRDKFLVHFLGCRGNRESCCLIVVKDDDDDDNDDDDTLVNAFLLLWMRSFVYIVIKNTFYKNVHW